MRPAGRVIDRWAFDHNGSDGGRAAKEGSRASTDARWRHGRDGLLRDLLQQMPRAADAQSAALASCLRTRVQDALSSGSRTGGACAMLPAEARPDHHFSWKTPAGSLRART